MNRTAGISILILALGSVGGWFLLSGDEGGTSEGGTSLGRGTYRVYVSVLEVDARKTTGAAWDIDGSGPDLAYEIEWKGQTVFYSSTRKDTLIGIWDAAELRLGDVLSGVSEAQVTRGARIDSASQEALHVTVYDRDVLRDDVLAKWDLVLGKLKVGSNSLDNPAPGVRKAVCVVKKIEADG